LDLTAVCQRATTELEVITAAQSYMFERLFWFLSYNADLIEDFCKYYDDYFLLSVLTSQRAQLLIYQAQPVSGHGVYFCSFSWFSELRYFPYRPTALPEWFL
jgi:hypothetical protein